MFFSGGLIPTYMVVSSLHMVNTRTVLVVMGTVTVYNMIIARTFFQNSLPEELFEAAELDGCGVGKFFFKIALPCSKAIIAVIALYVGVSQWNSYFTAMIYVTDQKIYPLQLVLRDILILGQQLTQITDPAEIGFGGTAEGGPDYQICGDYCILAACHLCLSVPAEVFCKRCYDRLRQGVTGCLA